MDVERGIDRVARDSGFSGAVRVDREGGVLFAKAYGQANRDRRIPNTVDTQFGIASGGKGLTALTVVSLIEDGTLGWSTTARSILGPDLPLIDGGVTVEHLLAHRSGIGDYLDEEAYPSINDQVLPVPVDRLVTTEDYLAVLDGHATKFRPGERFSYCNGGYVVLALLAERASGTPFHDLVRARVCDPAGMDSTAFLRSDRLPERAALGYLSTDDDTTNALHLPVRGSGDGGISSTLADVHALWRAVFDGRIVSPAAVAKMIRPRSDVPSERRQYGMGFWLRGSAVILEGYDAGVSFRSVHDVALGFTHTVVSNTTDGAWPVARRLEELFTA